MTLTKIDIIDYVAEKCNFSKKDATDLVESVFETIKDTLATGENVKISGFGNFVLRDKKARMGRNPQTGEAMEISSRRVLTFKVSQVMKEAINSAMGQTPPTQYGTPAGTPENTTPSGDGGENTSF